MEIPDYQTCMLPLLKSVQDGQEYAMNALVQTLADEFGLSDEQRQLLIPSGSSTLIGNRVGWARTYLKKAALLEAPRRGFIRITERGRSVLRDNPKLINVRFLHQFPEFVDFLTPVHAEELMSSAVTSNESTPDEALENAYQLLRESIESELLQRVKTASPQFLERLVVKLLVSMGYGGSFQEAGQALGKTGDGGIDGIIKEDRLGLDVIYLQAKRWEGVVGRPEIQRFAGALQGHRARKGVFITTSSFSKEAEDYVRMIDAKISLVNGATLAKLMAEHSIGVSTAQTYTVLKIDPDFFTEE